MNYLGTENVGGQPAWKFQRPDGATALTGDPLQAMQLGAPVFENTAPQVAAPEPMPDTRLASNEAMGEMALADLGAAERPVAPTSPAPPPEAPKPTIKLTPRADAEDQPAGAQMSPGQQFQQSEAARMIQNRAPAGMVRVAGTAGREETWMPGQRQGTTLTGDPEKDRALIEARKADMKRSRDEQVDAARQGVNAQLDSFAAQRDEAIGRIVDQDIKAIELEELAKRREDAMKTRLAERDEAVREASNLKINPNRIWEDASAGSKVLLTLGLALGAFSAGMSGGPNQALAMLQEHRKADTEKQLAERERLQGAAEGAKSRFADWMKVNDPELFRARAETAKIASQKAMAETMLAKSEYAQVHAQLPQVIAGLDAQLGEAMRAEENLISKQVGETFLPEIKATAGGYRPMTEKEIAERLKNNPQLGGALDGMAGEASADRVPLYDPSNGKQIGAVDKSNEKEARQYFTKSRGAINAIDTLDNMAERWSSMSPEERAAAGAQTAVLRQKVWSGVMGRSDAPSGAEAEAIEELIANPLEFFSSTDRARARLRTLRESQMIDTRSTARSFGLDPARMSFEKTPETQVE